MREDAALRKQVLGARGVPYLALPLLLLNAIGMVSVAVSSRDLTYELDERSVQHALRRRSVRITLEDRDE